MKKKVALFVIATNKYIEFVYPLYESIKKYFLVNHDVTVFVFTNTDKVPDGCVHIPIAGYGWPDATLKRYHIITDNRGSYSDFDHYYYCDADMLFVGDVGEEVFGNFMGVIHPSFYHKLFEPTYERNPKSTAFIEGGGEYYCGGFNGGSSYLRMASNIKEMIDVDLSNGIVAVWHDESYLNKYAKMNSPDVVLSPEYCYPENEELNRLWGILDIQPKLIALDKNKDEMRNV